MSTMSTLSTLSTLSTMSIMSTVSTIPTIPSFDYRQHIPAVHGCTHLDFDRRHLTGLGRF